MTFIVVDGIDGAGKTTLVRQLAHVLKKLDLLVTKEPTTNSRWGHRLRDSALASRLPKVKEIDYFHRDRLKHIRDDIRPALELGRTVISDRYVDSTLAYQAGTIEEADELYRTFLPDILVPDVTFILCCSVRVGLERIRHNRNSLSSFETHETLEIAKKVFESRNGDNYVLVDAAGTPENTFDQVMKELIRRFTGTENDLVAALEGWRSESVAPIRSNRANPAGASA